MLPAGKRALNAAELLNAQLLGEFGVERDLRTAGIDEKCDFGAAIYAYVDNWQRIGLHELHTRTFAVALQFVWRLALEAFQLRNIQTRILLNDQLVGAHVDAVQRGRCLLKVISTIKR